MTLPWFTEPNGTVDSQFFAETEQQQARVRLIIASAAAVYILALIASGGMAWGADLAATMLGFFLLAILIHWHAHHDPGIRHWRRGLAIGLDYTGMGVVISMGGAAMAPFFAAMLWVTLGYSIRYGRIYTRIAMAAALLCVLAIALVSPWWRGQPYFLVCIALMATAVPAYAHSLVTALRDAQADATRADLAKTRILAQASHDLRQPVQAISLFTACLKKSDLDRNQEEMVESIDLSLASISRLFRSLLELSTLDSGRIQPRPRAFAIGPVLAQLATQQAEAARGAGLRLRPVNTGAIVYSDPALLASMVQNLLSNAVKYAPGSKVVLGVKRRGDTLSVIVRDGGPGLGAAEGPERLFEEFYRSPQHRGYDGIGLGLSITRRTGRLLGLEVALSAAPGRGVQAEISGLQRAAAQPPIREGTGMAQPATLIEGMRILLAEDDEAVLLALRRLLESWGCVVSGVGSATAPIPPCDLILADHELADGTGMGVIARARAELGADLPAIIITGHDPERIASLVGDPRIPVLTKPVHPARLRAALISGMLRRRGPSAA